MTAADRRVALGRLFRRSKMLGYVDEQMLSVYRERGVVVKDEALNPNKTADDRSIYQLVEPGWLVVNRMKAWQGSVGIADLRGIVSGHYICFEPVHNENNRYLHYLLRSPAFTSHFAAISRGVRPGQMEIDNDELATTELSLPPVEVQQRIADFLDDQVTRIDNIIAARRRQLTLLAAESQASLDAMFSGKTGVKTRLGRFISRIEQGWSPQCEAIFAREDEWGVTKVSSVRSGRFEEQENKRLPDDLQPLREYEIKPGDLLVTRANTPALVGAFAVVPGDVRPKLILSDKIMRVDLSRGLDPEYVAMFGQTTPVRNVLTGSGTGASQSMVNIRGSDVRDLLVPIVDLPTQSAMARRRQTQVEACRQQENLLTKQVEVLAELKRSLITAAVTGELDVSAADGSQVPIQSHR